MVTIAHARKLDIKDSDVPTDGLILTKPKRANIVAKAKPRPAISEKDTPIMTVGYPSGFPTD